MAGQEEQPLQQVHDDFYRQRRGLIVSSFLLWLLSALEVQWPQTWQFGQVQVLFPQALLWGLWLSWGYFVIQFLVCLQQAQRDAVRGAWLDKIHKQTDKLLTRLPHGDQIATECISRLADTRLLQWMFRVMADAITASGDNRLTVQLNKEKLRLGFFERQALYLLIWQFVWASLVALLFSKSMNDYVFPWLLVTMMLCLTLTTEWQGNWLL